MAVAVAVAVLTTTLARGGLEAKRERAELARRLRVPVGPVTEIDPTQIGVDPAAQEVLEGGKVPVYVTREIDPTLRAALENALAGTGPWLVVVIGTSKVGKSRTLFEALLSCSTAKGLPVVAPVDGDALRSLLDPGQQSGIESEHAVLWLDDLEPFPNQGVTLQTLREWRSERQGWIVAGTYGGKGSELVANAASRDHSRRQPLLQHAREIALDATTDDELNLLRGRVPDAELAEIHRHGLAAYLVAGPALERKLATRRHGPGEPPCPEGVAVVHVAADWARCGRTDPIGAELLRAL